jgi:hypothetical protein
MKYYYVPFILYTQSYIIIIVNDNKIYHPSKKLSSVSDKLLALDLILNFSSSSVILRFIRGGKSSKYLSRKLFTN